MHRTPPNVRVSPQAHALLRSLAEEEQISMQAVLDKALEQYRRARFLRGANADFAALRRREKTWNEELDERALWDNAIGDGLDE